MIALLERDISGEGQWVQTSLLQSQISMLDFQAARWTVARQVPGQAGNDHPTSIPTGVFPTADGHINIAASGQHIFKRLCEALDAPGLIADPDFATAEKRSENRVRLNAELAACTRRYRSAELVERLNAAGVPSGPIYAIDQMFADPQVQHVGMAVPMPHPKRDGRGGGEPGGGVVAHAVGHRPADAAARRAYRGDPGRARLRQRSHLGSAPAQGDLRN